MKRGPLAFKDEKATGRYNMLMEDYFEVEKEYVFKKRKLQAQKQKLEILRDEVGFFRQRLAYLTKPVIAGDEAEPGAYKNEDIIEKEINCIAIEQSNFDEENNDKDEEMTEAFDEKAEKLSSNERKMKKKKVSWNEEVDVIYYLPDS